MDNEKFQQELIDIFNSILVLSLMALFSRDTIEAPQAMPVERTTYILDTSSIIDGRLAEVIEAGFLPGRFLLPQFILAELQHIADSSDDLRRQRGRFGLELVKKLQNMSKVNLEVTTANPEAPTVDDQLVELAKELDAFIITTDFNLNQRATIENLKVLNVNELAHALRPVTLPGERVSIKLIQKGSDKGQAVGYLQDGTMVVVEQARTRIGSEVSVEVTRIMQTVAGKMMFAKLMSESSNQSKQQKTPDTPDNKAQKTKRSTKSRYQKQSRTKNNYQPKDQNQAADLPNRQS